MKKRRVEFLRYFNDYRMIAMFTADVVAITVLSFLLSYSVMSIGGAPLSVIMLGSLIISISLLYAYIKAKRGTSKGFLIHWAFSKGIYTLKKDKNKYEELRYADNTDYFPYGQDKLFLD